MITRKLSLAQLTIYDLHKLLISHLQAIVSTNVREVALKLPQKNKIYINTSY